MDPKNELESIAGVEVHRLLQSVDGTVFGAIRLTRDLPATYAMVRRQGWTIARSADEAPEVANILALDPVPADTLLVQRDTADQLLDSVR